MALPLEMTLGEARAELQARLGFSTQGSATLRNQELLTSFLRKASRRLLYAADWSSLRRDLDISLEVGQDRYDFPDETEVGQIVQMAAINSRRELFPMEGGVDPQDIRGRPGRLERQGGDIVVVRTDDETYPQVRGQPERWRIVDGEIEIYPAASDEWFFLRVGYIRRPPPLVDDGEVLPFDSEAILQQAELFGRVHYGRPGVGVLRQELASYIAAVRRQQREPSSIHIGGKWQPAVVTRQEGVWQRPHYPRTGRDSVFYDGWRPW